MRQNTIETVVGALVLGVSAFLFYVVYQKQMPTTVGGGYEVLARFDRIDGIVEGADVRISGIKVGRVRRLMLDPQSYLAQVHLELGQGVQLPQDTVAQVSSEGLLGGRFIALVPGGSDDMIVPGGEITFTQSAINIESLVGQVIFGKEDAPKTDAPATSPAP